MEDREKKFAETPIANRNCFGRNEHLQLRHCFRPKKNRRNRTRNGSSQCWTVHEPLNGKRIFYMDGKDKDFFYGWVFDDEKMSSAELKNDDCWLKTSILDSRHGSIGLFLF
ncbi:hypothetical protein B9Z55_027919 [Caenorhabditis nigoni]|uniref:Uncharacterized protein n=1 Tax=Caenorhabditis nigoni TaxID=1611254 RepID=A0A2G5SEI5_9PELO|nr:hypothetical protein B9Z55_027919 [Caenorhabditis nigoni]